MCNYILIYSDKKLSQHSLKDYFVKIVKIHDSIKVTKSNKKDPYERVFKEAPTLTLKTVP